MDCLSTNNNRLSVTNDYDCILAMLLRSSQNGRLEMTQFSVPTTSGTVSVIRRVAKCNTFGLTAPGSLNTCPMCEGQRWIFNVPTILLWLVHKVFKFRSQSERPRNFRVERLLKAICQFDPAGTRNWIEHHNAIKDF